MKLSERSAAERFRRVSEGFASGSLNYHLRTLPRVFEVLKPDFVKLNEDMSYRGGPMLSEQCFNEFLALMALSCFFLGLRTA